MTEVKHSLSHRETKYLPEEKDEIVDRAETAILERIMKSVAQTESVSRKKNVYSAAQAKKIQNSMKKNGTVFKRLKRDKHASRLLEHRVP